MNPRGWTRSFGISWNGSVGNVTHLEDLLLDTKDGDWGLDNPHPDHSPHYVIRGADFPSARLGVIDSVPLRYLPDRSVWRRVLQPNDILFETAGGTKDRPTGRSLLVSERLLGSFSDPVIGASFTRFLRPDPSKVHGPFLFWYLQHLYAKGEMYEYQIQHTGIARFQYTTFAASKDFVLPGRGVQESVSSILGALDDKIVANKRIVRLLTELTAREYVAVARPGRSVRIDAIAKEMRRGVTPSYVENGGITVINQKCIRDSMVSLEPSRLSAESKRTDDRLLQRDDVLVNSTGQGTLGRAARWTDSARAVVDSHVTVVRFDPEKVNPVCAGTALIQIERQIEALAEGSTGQTELRRELLGSLHIQVPPRARQGEFGDLAHARDNLILALKSESDVLARTLDVLLPLLVSGNLPVKDAESLVEELI